jgi:hypothetical protein
MQMTKRRSGQNFMVSHQYCSVRPRWFIGVHRRLSGAPGKAWLI